MQKSPFKPFTLSYAETGQWIRFEPTDSPDTVFIRFGGACGGVQENLIGLPQVVEHVVRLYSVGYTEVEEPEGFEQKFLHDL